MITSILIDILCVYTACYMDLNMMENFPHVTLPLPSTKGFISLFVTHL